MGYQGPRVSEHFSEEVTTERVWSDVKGHYAHFERKRIPGKKAFGERS